MDNGTNALTVQNSNAWVEVSASALQHNIRTLQAELAGKSNCAPCSRLMPMATASAW